MVKNDRRVQEALKGGSLSELAKSVDLLRDEYAENVYYEQCTNLRSNIFDIAKSVKDQLHREWIRNRPQP